MKKFPTMLSFLQSRIRHVIFVLAAGCLLPTILQADEARTFAEAAQPGRLTRVQTILELSGHLKVNADGKKLIQLPLTGQGELVYDEKLIPSDDDSIRRSARYYRTAAAKLRLGERDVTNQLHDDRRLIASQASDSKTTVFSPTLPLTSDELELIDLQANTLLLARLLPEKPVNAGDTWTHDESLAAALFGLDVVTKSTLESVLKRVENNIAYFEMNGSVSGSVAGVSSELEAAAKYSFDLQKNRITWLALSIKENREVGHAEPGFELTARLRIAIQDGTECPELADGLLANLALEPSEAANCSVYVSEPGGFRIMHDRNWHIMIDRNDVTILRYIDRGELVAQCNISRLPDAASGKQLAMEAFQTDIRRVLDKNFSQFVDAKESKGENGTRVLKTIVAGVASELPIQWNYYHLTDKKGRQATLVFTMDSKFVERFGAADQTILSTFEMSERKLLPATEPAASTAKSKEKEKTR